MAGGTRECRCTCDGFAMFLRIFSFLACLCTAAAAGWGFILANKRWQTENLTVAGNSTLNDLAAGLTSLNRSIALFQGLMSVYYVLFSFLGMFAELRTRYLRGTVLRHLTFLTTYFGRACFLIYIGSIFVLIPWDDERDWVSKTCGGMLLGGGVGQMLFFFFVKKNQRGPDSEAAASGAVATGAGKPVWPPTGEDGASGSGEEASVSNGLATPSRQALLAVQKTTVFANPVHPSNLPPGAGTFSSSSSDDGGSASSYAAAPQADIPPPPPPVDGAGVPVRNPFHQAA